MLALPDPNTLRDRARGAARTRPSPACSATSSTSRRSPFEGDPRHVLQAQPRPGPRARASRSTPRPRWSSSIFAVGRHAAGAARHRRLLRPHPARHGERPAQRQTILTLEAMGIPVEYSFHEHGPSQHEIDLRYTDALTMADNVMTFRLVVKQVANELGVYATFMPKPIEGAFGLGHAHARVAVRGRRQRVPRPGRRVRPVEGRQALHRRAARTTRARSPRSPTRRSTPTSG